MQNQRSRHNNYYRKSIEKSKFKKEATKLKKFAEFTFIFFNKNCMNLYQIPTGFEVMFSKNQEEKIKFYGSCIFINNQNDMIEIYP